METRTSLLMGKADDGYRLTYGGLDYLALHTHFQRKTLQSTGPCIGTGKESDIHLVLGSPHDARPGAHVVGHDDVAALAPQLGRGVVQQPVGLGREADDEPGAARVPPRHGGEDVGVAVE
ncbi:MAG: hypothetical protein Q9212_005146, partial [Teloschistes hypoglaucus]